MLGMTSRRFATDCVEIWFGTRETPFVMREICSDCEISSSGCGIFFWSVQYLVANCWRFGLDGWEDG
jgi:hypothetical protein